MSVHTISINTSHMAPYPSPPTSMLQSLTVFSFQIRGSWICFCCRDDGSLCYWDWDPGWHSLLLHHAAHNLQPQHRLGAAHLLACLPPWLRVETRKIVHFTSSFKSATFYTEHLSRMQFYNPHFAKMPGPFMTAFSNLERSTEKKNCTKLFQLIFILFLKAFLRLGSSCA